MDGQFDVIVWLQRPSCVCVRACVRDNAVVDELFIFYGISVKLSTILSTYHGHCLFIMRICCCECECVCVFTCQFSWTTFSHGCEICCVVQVFLVVLVTQSFQLSFSSSFSVLFFTARCYCCCSCCCRRRYCSFSFDFFCFSFSLFWCTYFCAYHRIVIDVCKSSSRFTQQLPIL